MDSFPVVPNLYVFKLILTRKQELLQMILAAIAGYVDAFGLIRFKTYLSFMSGNTTQTGSLLAKGNFGDAMLAITAIFSFFIGVFLGHLPLILKFSNLHRYLFFLY